MHVSALFDLHGRTALVTGGGRGIGRHIALGLAEAGADVFVASRKLADCEETAERIRALGRRSEAFPADVGRPEEVERLAESALAACDRLHVLVNNAGMAWAAPTLEYPLEAWERVFAVNVRGAWLLTQRVARHMKERGGGSIVQVGSISAFRGARDAEQPVVAYNASKGALVSLTIDLAVKLAADGIRVNCIAPGPFYTRMMDHVQHDPERLRAFEAHSPMRRSGEEDDIKGVAVFLAAEASRYVTGQTLVVDGGVSCVY